MADLKLNHVYKVYPNGVKAVNDFTMDIKDKEFIVFVGPSGCGKSTTLRMIAGLEDITAGELYIGDSLVNDVEPKDRDIAMVFQNYALYPHMTVYENMAFGLKLRKMQKEEIDRKVREAAEILDITDYLERKPKEMSGGQRQRVALGRAIVREPKVFLLDEPLSNLDAKLRTGMRSQISALHKKLQTTFVYVTHDQVEAMTMGTRIVVMKDGYVQQIDTPTNLYRYPANVFVGGFIGTPQMNFYKGRIKSDGAYVEVEFYDTEVSARLNKEMFAKADTRKFVNGVESVFGIRAEHISVNPDAYPYKAKVRVSHIEELGTESQVHGDFNINGEVGLESPTKVVIKAPTMTSFEAGSVIDVSIDFSAVHIFDAETEQNVIPRIPESVCLRVTATDGCLIVGGGKIVLPPAMGTLEGEYMLDIPTSAVSLGGGISATITKTEEINNRYLAHIKAGEDRLFALIDEHFIGETDLDIDLKRVTVRDLDGNVVCAPIPTVNSIPGRITRSRSKEKRSFIEILRSAANPVFAFEMLDKSFPCDLQTTTALVNIGGSKIVGNKLEFGLTPYDFEVAEDGIVCEVEAVLDYGKEVFAKCSVGGTVLYVAVPGKELGQMIKIRPSVDKMSVTDVERNIRLK